jgi:hypothetical protein
MGGRTVHLLKNLLAERGVFSGADTYKYLPHKNVKTITMG